MERLNARQFDTLERLVEVPSAYSQVDPKGSEVEIQERIWEMLQDCGVRLERQRVGNPDEGRFNIIAHKGSPIEEAEYVAMMYVHVDTIKMKREWEGRTDYKLTRDGDVLRGVGVYDMKAGVMALIDILQEVEIPSGLTVVGAFCVGEERDSDGIKQLMEWPYIKKVRIVVSPEITSMGNDETGKSRESDLPKDVIVGRPGNVKTQIELTSGGGHAFDFQTPNTNTLARLLMNHLAHALHSRDKGSVLAHPDFYREGLSERDIHTVGSGEFESVAEKTALLFTIRTVPPTTEEEIRSWMQRELGKLGIIDEWEKRGIGGIFSPYGCSYNPFVARTDSQDAQAVFSAVKEHYGDVRLSAGQSVADSNLGHAAMNREIEHSTQYQIAQVLKEPCSSDYVPWLDIGPCGSGPHKRTERVYERSLVMLIEFYRSLFTEHLPSFLSHRRKRA